MPEYTIRAELIHHNKYNIQQVIRVQILLCHHGLVIGGDVSKAKWDYFDNNIPLASQSS
jgi:hypothetical protein